MHIIFLIMFVMHEDPFRFLPIQGTAPPPSHKKKKHPHSPIIIYKQSPFNRATSLKISYVFMRAYHRNIMIDNTI